MKIGTLDLPAQLTQALATGNLSREIGSWRLLSDVDSWGNPLETELGYVYETQAEIEHETGKLAEGFPAVTSAEDDAFTNEHVTLYGCEAAAIPYIRDFSMIVCFAISGDGAPFCLDYRNDVGRPSVIWWDDVYWRRVSPDFESFLLLFDLSKK